MFDLDFLPPPELQRSLWRSLVINLADRFAPERLAPLQLTSKPIDVVLPADTLELPWYRTVFTNIGDVISPEKLPPLNLTSSPIDIGEMLGDELSHGWWNSLLQTVRERLAPERLAPLELTSQPVPGFGAESTLQILDWSDLIAGPKTYLPDQPQVTAIYASSDRGDVAPVVEAAPPDPTLAATRSQIVRDIGRTRFRRKIWIAVAAAQAVFLVVAIFKLQ
jgi:hypothetical protein